MLLALKIVGILVSAFFGVYALLHDYRDTAGRVTRQGQFAIGGIFLGALVGAVATAIEEIESNQTTERQLGLLSTQIDSTVEVLHRIDRVANRFVVEQASLSIDVHSIEFSNRVLEVGAQSQRHPHADCPVIAENLGATLAMRFAMPTTDKACSERLAKILEDHFLPQFVVSVSERWDYDIDGHFRIALTERVPLNPNTDLYLYVWRNEGAVQINFDDVPVQWQTVRILAIEDFVGRELFVKVEDWGFISHLNNPGIRLRWLNLKFQDGRDMPLYLSAPRSDHVGASWHAEFIFPTSPEEMTELVDVRMIAPTDADR